MDRCTPLSRVHMCGTAGSLLCLTFFLEIHLFSKVVVPSYSPTSVVKVSRNYTSSPILGIAGLINFSHAGGLWTILKCFSSFT